MKPLFTAESIFNIFQIQQAGNLPPLQVSTYDLLQYACFPIAKADIKTDQHVNVRFSLIIDDQVIDIIQQQWAWDGSVEPDIQLAAYSAELSTDGHGYDNKEELINDCLSEHDIESAEQVKEMKVRLKIELLPVLKNN